jgi:hypothetical protein
MNLGKGRIYINGREVGTGKFELDPLPGSYWDIKIGNEVFRHCYRCDGRGRRKLRQRSRGRGRGGRYGPCPQCEGRGGRWKTSGGWVAFGAEIPLRFTLDEIHYMNPEVLKLFFNGSGGSGT